MQISTTILNPRPKNPRSWCAAGFHYYRWQLDSGVAGAPAQAHARRGAHWTFDAEAFVQCVRAVREGPVGAAAGSGAGTGILVPTFAHGVGDPVAGGVTVMPHHKIVLIEGNYLLLGDCPTLRRVPVNECTAV